MVLKTETRRRALRHAAGRKIPAAAVRCRARGGAAGGKGGAGPAGPEPEGLLGGGLRQV